MARYFLVLFAILAFLYLNRSYAYFYDFQGDNFIVNPNYQISHLINRDDRAETLKMVVLGDSLMAGTGSSDEENSMAYLIAQNLSEKDNVKLVNLARPGVGVEDVLNRQVIELINEQPDYVLLMIGTNDVHNKVFAGDFGATYERILQEIRTKTKAKITIINIPYIGSSKIIYPPWDKILNYRINEFNRIIDSEAGKFDLQVIDLNSQFRDKFEDKSEFYSADQFHPSDKGYALWAEYINSHLIK